ncbi:hypothetical protein HanIR_Chr11g0543911 [Helianthus annuus]|nr:hypothetical protein HanIR_Chr11g0543911 [Helianthus annuus]
MVEVEATDNFSFSFSFSLFKTLTVEEDDVFSNASFIRFRSNEAVPPPPPPPTISGRDTELPRCLYMYIIRIYLGGCMYRWRLKMKWMHICG